MDENLKVRHAEALAVHIATRLRDEEATTSVPVCVSESTVQGSLQQAPRARQLVFELQMLWSAKHDKPVPKPIVESAPSRRSLCRPSGPDGAGQVRGRPDSLQRTFAVQRICFRPALSHLS
jgi:hypothetical protein